MPFHPRPSSPWRAEAERRRLVSRLAFTLIELLTVISIIAVLAALTVPVLRGVKRQQYLRNTTAEMEQIETAIERYKADEGFYPPDNTNRPTYNQLYYELTGTTNTGTAAAPVYQSLANGVTVNASDLPNTFYVGGFMNCTRPGGGEDAPVAKDFLSDLKPTQYGVVSNFNNTVPATILLVSVGGPDLNYKPFGPAGVTGMNPWRYNSSNPTNNPGAYDLWVQLSIGGKTNLVCNWNKQAQLNSPLP
jgi:prepilin-type N-terminal cleavage/methylation domain-containing protein